MMSKATRTHGGNRLRVLLAIALLTALMLPSVFTAPVARAAGGPPDATFTNSSNPSQGGNNVWGVAVADFNGDGKQDMAVTAIDNSLTIYSGNGDGTFTLASRLGGIGGWNVVAADFNGDGKPDLAVVDRSGNVAVLINTAPANSSAITFAPVQTFAVGSSPVGIAVGDFNGDGKPDLAVSNSGSSTSVSVLRNTTVTGSATAIFAPAKQIEVGNPSLFVAVGDFDGDGKADIAVGGQSSTNSGGGGTLRILMNTSATFGATSTEIAFGAYVPITNGVTDPLNLVVDDFNGDGRPDLAVTDGTTGAVSVLLNAQSGDLFGVGKMSPYLLR